MTEKWNDAAVLANTMGALKDGIDKTTSEGAIEAKRLVHTDTATLQGSIYPEPAKLNSNGEMEGAYGPHSVSYAAEQEFLIGEQMPEGGTRTRRGGKPYMRPSKRLAEEKLMPNIMTAYKGAI